MNVQSLEEILENNADRMVMLSKLFVRHDRFLDLEQRVAALARQRRAELRDGEQRERKGLSVIGPSGAGKSKSLEKIKRKYQGPREGAPDDRVGSFVTVETPSPGTLKSTGIATLEALKFEIVGDPNAAEIWRLVRHHLYMHKVTFLHFDEAQDFILNQSGRESTSVVNTIKSLTQCKKWPVSVILSGNTVLADILDSDFQLGRRVPPVFFENLAPETDLNDVEHILSQYLSAAGLELKRPTDMDDFLARLIFSASCQLGLVFEFILEAIQRAFDAQRLQLCVYDFRDVYRDRTGAVDGANPFVASDYQGINTRVILEGKLTKQKGPKKVWVTS